MKGLQGDERIIKKRNEDVNIKRSNNVESGIWEEGPAPRRKPDG